MKRVMKTLIMSHPNNRNNTIIRMINLRSKISASMSQKRSGVPNLVEVM